jgi:hypothetical protein
LTTYDDWKLASPPEADEEDMRAECTEPRDDDDPCDYSGWVTAMVTNQTHDVDVSTLRRRTRRPDEGQVR